jgi:hypothetical protein
VISDPRSPLSPGLEAPASQHLFSTLYQHGQIFCCVSEALTGDYEILFGVRTVALLLLYKINLLVTGVNSQVTKGATSNAFNDSNVLSANVILQERLPISERIALHSEGFYL